MVHESLANDVETTVSPRMRVYPGDKYTGNRPQSEEQKRAVWTNKPSRGLENPGSFGAVLFLTSDDAAYHWPGNCCRRRSVSHRLRK